MEENEILRIYNQAKAQILDGCTPSHSPIAILTGGSPASGKGSLGDQLTLEHPTVNILSIDGDVYRSYHPQDTTLKRLDPIAYTTETQPFCAIFKREVIQDCIHNKYSFVLEGTLGSPDATLSIIRDLKAAGYQVEVHAVASNPTLTQLGLTRRYSEEVFRLGAGRLATNNFELARGMSKTLDAIYLSESVDKISLYVQCPPKTPSEGVFRLEKAREYIHTPEGWNVRNLPSFEVNNLRNAQIRDVDLIKSYITSTEKTLQDLEAKGTDACLKASGMLSKELEPVQAAFDKLVAKGASMEVVK